MTTYTDTAFLRVLGQYLDQGATDEPPFVNHAPPDWNVPVPAQGMGPRRLIVTTAGVTTHLDGWTTLLAAIIVNRDATNLVEVTYHYLDQAAVDKTNTVPIQPGGFIILNGPITLANNLVMASFNANCVVDYSLYGT